MTPIEINIAIAEACGWSDFKTGPYDGQPFGIFPPLRGWTPIPDYCHDLNAMEEAEAILQDEQTQFYVEQLYELMRAKSIIHGTVFVNVFKVVHSTAAQRAEAFLRTIGKWDEK